MSSISIEAATIHYRIAARQLKGRTNTRHCIGTAVSKNVARVFSKTFTEPCM
jgi:hypothetical protein